MSNGRKSSLPDELKAPLERLSEELIYQPTDQDKRLKAQFWLKAADNPFITPDSITIDDVRNILNREISGSTWARPGFKEWFVNKDESRQRLEYLFNLALDAAEQIIMNTDPKAQSARVNMIKVIADLGGKNPRIAGPSAGQSAIAGAIAGMDKAQLDLFLQKNGVNLKLSASKDSPQVVEVEPEELP